MTPADLLNLSAICFASAAFVDRYQPRVDWFLLLCVTVVSVTVGMIAGAR